MVDTTIEQNQWFNGEKVHEKYVMLDGPISSYKLQPHRFWLQEQMDQRAKLSRPQY
jgi:hypothetical protein